MNVKEEKIIMKKQTIMLIKFFKQFYINVKLLLLHKIIIAAF